MTSETPSWYRPRGYRHLDRPISISAATDLVTSPERVAHHAFWPFLGYEKSTPRYKPDIHKVKAKSRPIAYASHVDSLIYSYYCERISALYEAQLATRGLQQVVLAYRRFPGGKSNIHFA